MLDIFFITKVKIKILGNYSLLSSNLRHVTLCLGSTLRQQVCSRPNQFSTNCPCQPFDDVCLCTSECHAGTKEWLIFLPLFRIWPFCVLVKVYLNTHVLHKEVMCVVKLRKPLDVNTSLTVLFPILLKCLVIFLVLILLFVALVPIFQFTVFKFLQLQVLKIKFNKNVIIFFI